MPPRTGNDVKETPSLTSILAPWTWWSPAAAAATAGVENTEDDVPAVLQSADDNTAVVPAAEQITEGEGLTDKTTAVEEYSADNETEGESSTEYSMAATTVMTTSPVWTAAVTESTAVTTVKTESRTRTPAVSVKTGPTTAAPGVSYIGLQFCIISSLCSTALHRWSPRRRMTAFLVICGRNMSNLWSTTAGGSIRFV